LPTLKEIAQRANVSIGTVDRVIHNRGNVSKQKANIIRQIIKELNYKPNLHAQQLQKNRKFTFAVIMPEVNPELGYWPMAIRGAEKAGEELWKNNVRVTFFYYDANSRQSFIQTSEKIEGVNPDGLLIAPGLYLDVIHDFILEFNNKIPYVFFDSPVNGTYSLCDILQDAYHSGWLSGRLMHLLLPNSARIAVISVAQKGNHLRNRAEGFMHYFHDKQQYDCHLFCPAHIDSPLHDIDHVIDSIFDVHHSIDGIFATNALIYKVVEYLIRRFGEAKRTALIGYDLTPGNIKYLKNGWIDFLISQRPEVQSYRGIYCLYRHVVLKEKIDRTLMMPLDIVTRENIAFYQEI
jgi:LacI family transcriptional regulator